ncbi:MAG: phosphoadenylyl-sulfate reductase [Saprospiraceae bacterium]
MAKKIEVLNKMFKQLTIEERIEQLYEIFPENEVLYTSSFGTSAAFLLNLVSRLRPTQKVFFIDTGYHFKETLAYKNQLTEAYQLNVTNLIPDEYLHGYSAENKLWESDPNTCCHVNKVLPLECAKSSHRVWISGLMGFQSSFRENLNVFEQQGDIIKFYPLIDITELELKSAKIRYNIPEHPLKSQGYASVGCEQCTFKGQHREGRWKGKGKVECGLHFPKKRLQTI